MFAASYEYSIRGALVFMHSGLSEVSAAWLPQARGVGKEKEA